MDKIGVRESASGSGTVSEVTGSNDGSKVYLDVKPQAFGTDLNPLAKYVEATYSNGDMTVTYKYYESSLKATLYNTITVNYTEAQDTSFTSAEWS